MQPIDPDEYAICQRRGHEHGNITYGTGHSQCRWCKVGFKIVTTEHVEELNPPARIGDTDD